MCKCESMVFMLSFVAVVDFEGSDEDGWKEYECEIMKMTRSVAVYIILCIAFVDGSLKLCLMR